jgi:hypothetical protein
MSCKLFNNSVSAAAAVYRAMIWEDESCLASPPLGFWNWAELRKTLTVGVQYFVDMTTKTINQTLWPESTSELYRPSDRRLLAKLVLTFADRGCHVVSVMDPYGRILGFLDRSLYFFSQVAPQLYSRGWVGRKWNFRFHKKKSWKDYARQRPAMLSYCARCSWIIKSLVAPKPFPLLIFSVHFAQLWIAYNKIIWYVSMSCILNRQSARNLTWNLVSNELLGYALRLECICRFILGHSLQSARTTTERLHHPSVCIWIREENSTKRRVKAFKVFFYIFQPIEDPLHL